MRHGRYCHFRGWSGSRRNVVSKRTVAYLRPSLSKEYLDARKTRMESRASVDVVLSVSA
jgi:hypothetical protein